MPGALAGLSPRPTGSRSTCPRRCRACAPTPRCSSGRSPTWSRTPSRGRRPTATVRVEAVRRGGAGRPARHRPRPRHPVGAARATSSSPFQRLGDRSNGSGVGLGLAVARGFVEAMGGELVVEDTPGGGVTMVISLPAARHDASAASSTTSRRSCARSASTCAPAATTSTSPPTARTRSTLAAAPPSRRRGPRPRAARASTASR